MDIIGEEGKPTVVNAPKPVESPPHHHKSCRCLAIEGVDEAEVFEALKLLSHRIEDMDYISRGNSGMEDALTRNTKNLLERLR
jgi:hypothetical protein